MPVQYIVLGTPLIRTRITPDMYLQSVLVYNSKKRGGDGSAGFEENLSLSFFIGLPELKHSFFFLDVAIGSFFSK